MAWSGGMSAGNALQAGGSFYETLANYGAAKANIKNMTSAAKYQAEMLKKQGFSDASSARAAAAENGVDVDVGSAAMIQDQHVGDAAYNSYMVESQSKYQAKIMKRQAKTALVSGLLGSGAKLFGG